MLETLQAWDEALLLWFNGRPEALSGFAWTMTSKWATVPVVLVLLWALFRKHQRRVAWFGFGLFVLCVAGTDAISSRLMKPGFGRLRPSHTEQLANDLHLHADDEGRPYRGGRYGFVSSHAANTFGLATLAFLFFGGGPWIWLFAFAALVSWTRIYLGVHYPGDIVFGAAFGAGWACALWTVAKRFALPLLTPTK